MGLAQRDDELSHLRRLPDLAGGRALRADRRRGLPHGAGAGAEPTRRWPAKSVRQVANALRGPSLPRVSSLRWTCGCPRPDEADERIDTVVQPDVLAVCDPAKLSERGVRGAPDWVLEVLSPATAGHDQVRKRRIYEQAGVREYWMVHPTDRVLTVYRLENGAYGSPDTQLLEGTTPVGVLPGVVVAWDELAARLPKPEY
ncbi:MAG: Uma2 family endonuclease [Comamonadaceae bacterium]|nr:Uma2 family endonuclease [Comamonadaceae bacterium]